MFFVEMEKYGVDPMTSMFDDLGAEGFSLLLSDIGPAELKKILEAVPEDRADILAVIRQLIADRD